MDAQPPQPGGEVSEPNRSMGASSNTSRLCPPQERRHQLVHHHAATEATKHMTQNAHWKIVCKTGSSKNRKHHAIGCGYIHTVVNCRQLTVWRTAGVRRALCDQLITALNGKPPGCTKAIICTVLEIQQLHLVSSMMFMDELRDKHPREWTTQAIMTLEEATEGYMVNVIAESHC